MKISLKSVIVKCLKITGISIAAILLILFLFPVFFSDTISEKVKSFANKSLDGELNFSKTHLSFFDHFPSLTFSLHNFTLTGSAPFKNDTLLAASKVSFGINIKSLLFDKRINIDKIFVSNAAIHVEVNESGAPNYNVYVPAKTNDTGKKADSSGTALRLEKIVIENSHLIYDDKSTAILIDAKGFNYTGNGDLSQAIFDMQSHAKIESLDFYFDKAPYLLRKKVNADLITSINTNSLAFFFQKNNVLINKLPVEFSGKLNFLQNGFGMDFTINAVHTDLDNLVTALPPQFITWQQKTKITGIADLLLTIKGNYISSANTIPDLAFYMKIRDGSVAYEGTPLPASNLFLNLETKMPALNTDSLRLKVDSVFFKIGNNYLSAVINTTGIHEPQITARISSHMDLEQLDKAFGISVADMKGKMDVQLSMDGRYASGPNPNSLRHEEITLGVPAFNLKAILKDGYFRYNALPVPITNINFIITGSCPDNNYQHTGFSITGLSANALNNFLKGNASISNLQEMMIDANLQSDINLGDIKNIYPVAGTDLAGLLKFNIKSKGRYDAIKKTFPVTEAGISLQNGSVKTSYYPNPVSDIHLSAKLNSTGTLKTTAVELQPASLMFEGNPLQVQATLKDFEDIAYDIKANGKSDIARIYKVFSQKGQDVSGFITADVSLHGKQSDAIAGRYNKMDNHGTLAIRNIKLVSDNFPQPFEINEGEFKFSNDKMWFSRFLASYGHSDFKMDGYLQNVIEYALSKNASLKGNFNMNARFINVDEFMAFAPVKTAGTTAPEKAVKPGNTTTGVIIVPSNLDLSFTATADKVNYNGLNIENAEANIRIDQSKIALTKTGFDLIGCNVQLDAVYGSISPQKAFFESHLQAKEFDIQKAYREVKLFHDMATAAASAQGIISLDYRLKGKLDENMQPVYASLDGGGVISVKKIQMKGFKLLSAVSNKTGKDAIKDPELSKIDIKSTIKNNVISVERFKIKTDGFRLRIEGQTNFNGTIKMKMRLGLPPLGIIGIPMIVTGTQEKPVIKIGKGDKDGVPETDYKDD